MSSKGVCFSPGSYLEGFTPWSLGPCSTLARAHAGNDARSADPAPSFKNSRLRNHTDFGVISMMGLYAQCTEKVSLPAHREGALDEVSSGFGGFGFADDRRNRRRQSLGRLGGRRRALPFHARVPPLAGGALLVGRQFGAVRVADDAC